MQVSRIRTFAAVTASRRELASKQRISKAARLKWVDIIGGTALGIGLTILHAIASTLTQI